MAADLLGLRLYWRGRGRHKRLVGGRRAGLCAEGLSAQGGVLRPGTAGPDPGAPADGAGHADCRRADGLPAGRRHRLGRSGGPGRSPAGREGRSRRRRLHFLYVGHHRQSQRRAADSPRLYQQSVQPGVLRPGPGPGHRARDGRRRRSHSPRADPRGAVDHAPVPRHRQQLRRLSGHRGRRQDRADVSLGRRRGPETDRAGKGLGHERGAGHVARTDRPSGLSQDRHLEPVVPGRRRGGAASGPGGQDRRAGGHRPAQYRLWHD